MSQRSPAWKKIIRANTDASIKAPNLKNITLAQWALESGWGTSDLAVKHNNYGGLKYRERMQDYAEPVDYEAHDGIDTYCKFESAAAFVEGYWHFIESGPYDGWDNHSDDPLGYIKHIHAAGYAGDPNYVAKVANLYDQLAAELNFNEELDRMSRREFGELAAVSFEVVQGKSHRTRGKYVEGLEGIIVHYDAGRIKPKGSALENSDWGSRKTIEWGASQGYRYLCISRTGLVFAPDNWDWDHWGSHAGDSKCPNTNRTWVSKYFAGIEMNNPGLLYEAQEDGVFCPWFNSRRNASGGVILDSRKRCYRLSEDDEWYSSNQVRHASGGNIYSGYYLPYTEAQFNALKAVVLMAAAERPNSFNFDYIYRHDEASPGRKQDPGGALAYDGRLMRMSEFRNEIAAYAAF